MLLTSNEGQQQHAFFVPQLGPAPKWCAFLDNLVEEMADDPNDPASFGNSRKAGEVYDNYKFLTLAQLKQLSMDHLVGTTSLLRPYMHGFFVNQKLYEEAMLINNPTILEEQRAKSIKQKIDKERESRIRGKKKVQVKVNRKLAEKIIEREEKNQLRKAKRVLKKGGDDEMVDAPAPAVVAPDAEEEDVQKSKPRPDLLKDDRFARLFEQDEFEIDESSREFQVLNPSTQIGRAEETSRKPRGLTAVEQEALDEAKGSDSSDGGESSEDETFTAKRKADENTFVNSRNRSQGRPAKPKMRVSNSVGTAKANVQKRQQKDKSFGSRAVTAKEKSRDFGTVVSRGAVGEKEVSFVPAKKGKKPMRFDSERRDGDGKREKKDRRSASGNVFRQM
jgi:ribosome biogenesis protein ENP2